MYGKMLVRLVCLHFISKYLKITKKNNYYKLENL